VERTETGPGIELVADGLVACGHGAVVKGAKKNLFSPFTSWYCLVYLSIKYFFLTLMASGWSVSCEGERVEERERWKA